MKFKTIHMAIISTLTFRTSLAWNSGVQLWWMKPMPPVSCRQTYISVFLSQCTNMIAGIIKQSYNSRKLSIRVLTYCHSYGQVGL